MWIERFIYLTDVKLKIYPGIPYRPTFFKASTENSNGSNCNRTKAFLLLCYNFLWHFKIHSPKNATCSASWYLVWPNVTCDVISRTGLSGRVMCNLQHCLGDFFRLLKVHFTSDEGMSNDAPIHECESGINHYTDHCVPYSLRRVCGFFNVPQIYYMCKGLWDGAYGLSSLSEKTRKSNRLQMLYKGSTFSAVIFKKTLGVAPAGVWTYGLPLSRPALIPLS